MFVLKSLQLYEGRQSVDQIKGLIIHSKTLKKSGISKISICEYLHRASRFKLPFPSFCPLFSPRTTRIYSTKFVNPVNFDIQISSINIETTWYLDIIK